MGNPFILRLEGQAPLSERERRMLEALTAEVTHLEAREDILRAGDEPRAVNVVLSGWACCYKALPDGRRQIVALFLPGDMCDPYGFLLDAGDHALGTLTPVTVAKVPARSIRDVTAGGPELGEVLWRQALTAIAIQREWMLSLGRRDAQERLAHLFCEVSMRLADVGLSDGEGCDMPLTQSDLADILGPSTVHVNRSVQALRAGGLIELRNRHLTIRDLQALRDVAMFDPTYLHRRSV